MADRGFEKVARDLSSDFASLRDDIRRLSDVVADLAHDQVNSTRGNAHGMVDRARDRFSATADRLTSQANDMADRFAGQASQATDRVRGASQEIEARIERNPMTAVMIAIVGGLLIGAMSRSRK